MDGGSSPRGGYSQSRPYSSLRLCTRGYSSSVPVSWFSGYPLCPSSEVEFLFSLAGVSVLSRYSILVADCQAHVSADCHTNQAGTIEVVCFCCHSACLVPTRSFGIDHHSFPGGCVVCLHSPCFCFFFSLYSPPSYRPFWALHTFILVLRSSLTFLPWVLLQYVPLCLRWRNQCDWYCLANMQTSRLVAPGG